MYEENTNGKEVRNMGSLAHILVLPPNRVGIVESFDGKRNDSSGRCITVAILCAKIF
jgi:hypothetical protein